MKDADKLKTREGAAKKLKDILAEATETDDSVCYVTPDDADVLKAAIEALEQEPCGDCISRENAIKQCGFGMTSLLIAGNLRRLPPVTPQQKTGRWIFDKILDKHYYCSECKSMGVDYWDYCPNCGAKMEG